MLDTITPLMATTNADENLKVVEYAEAVGPEVAATAYQTEDDIGEPATADNADA